MSKKVSLIVAVMLALAPLASATLTDGGLHVNGSSISNIIINTDQILTVQLFSGNTNSYLAYIIVEEVGTPIGTLSKALWNANAGDQAGNSAYTEGGWGVGYEFTTADSTGAIISGIQHTIDFSSAVEGIAVLGLFEGDGPYGLSSDELATLTVTVVPEPASMAILALGGLFLRRRKK